jgi:2-C-methyl-D-erythritol 4-phosphate cytidylyltransferase
MHVAAILLAAGQGLRLKSKVSKPLITINSKPLIIYSLSALNKNRWIKEIIIVGNNQNIAGIRRLVDKYDLRKVIRIIRGGRRRQDSVHNGISQVGSSADLVLIHDAARPFISLEIIYRVIRKARGMAGAITGVPVNDTIKNVFLSKEAKLIVKHSLNRKQLWMIQTPQVFKVSLIREAFRRFGKDDVTDESMLLERLGKKVGVVLGSYDNIKVTTPGDILIAKTIAKNFKICNTR